MSESQETLVDPTLLSNERLLVIDHEGLYNARIYQLGEDRALPMYTIRSRGSQKNIANLRCYLHSGIDGQILGEMSLHGMLKRGAGTVATAGARPVGINDWMKDSSKGRTFMFDGVTYTWSKPAFKSQPSVPVLEINRDRELVATFMGPCENAFGKQTSQTHVSLADDIDTEAILPFLLLSFSIYQHRERIRKMKSMERDMWNRF